MTDTNLQYPAHTTSNSNNLVHSNNLSNSHNLNQYSHSNLGRIGIQNNIYIPPNQDVQALIDSISKLPPNRDEEMAVDEDSVSPLSPRGSLQANNPWAHSRQENMVATYSSTQSFAMRSSEGTTCRFGKVTNKNLKLSDDVADHVEKFMRTTFLKSFSNAIYLWVPSQGCKPGPTPIPRRSIDLGDVGFFNDAGGFEILFNVYLSEAENRSHGYHPPPGFINHLVGIPEEDKESRDLSGPQENRLMAFSDDLVVRKRHLGSDRGPLVSLEPHSSTAPVGASALILPDGMVRITFRLGARDALQSYVKGQVASWYRFYKTHLPQKIQDGSLLLVTACYKARTWAMASKAKNTRDKRRVRMELHKPDPSADIYVWEYEGDIEVQTGPSEAEMENRRALRDSQCMAVEVSALQIGNEIVRSVHASLLSIKSNFSKTSQVSWFSRRGSRR